MIADHARATAFAIADGILPGNEGRNYVLRKIMRRAIYHGREHLGLERRCSFTRSAILSSSDINGAYPELETQREFIGKMVRLEEERFGKYGHRRPRTSERSRLAASTPKDDDLFLSIGKLYDTFGTPRDLIRVFLEEKGLEFEEDDFNERFDAALAGTAAASRNRPDGAQIAVVAGLCRSCSEKVGANEFHGYDATHIDDAKVVAILDGEKSIDSLERRRARTASFSTTLRFTPSPAARLATTGKLASAPIAIALRSRIHIHRLPGLIIHKVTVEKGSIKVGDDVDRDVSTSRNAMRRDEITRRRIWFTRL